MFRCALARYTFPGSMEYIQIWEIKYRDIQGANHFIYTPGAEGGRGDGHNVQRGSSL